LRLRLSHLDADNARRRTVAASYRDRMKGINALQLPRSELDSEHVYHLFVVRTTVRDELASGLAARGIGSMVHYPRPPHRQAVYAKGALHMPLPVTEILADEVLSLPMWPSLTEEQIEHVAAAVREVLVPA
jgi:dTDP-3-amino-3,4,6-trideoxy-alpha-D-glucose transaminase